ncbi:MAG: hypothetical protein QOG72_3432 [Sphingomonadales bacterium]|jgi:hypothetical protein|nr:hypothetical protein [Sphingomonadales bacterium]
MARKARPRGDPLAGWKTFGLPAFASALAPWQVKLTQAALIPDWYQPQANGLASLVGPLVCFCLWLTCDRLSRRVLVRLCLGALALLGAGLAGCLALLATLDIVWFPEEAGLAVIQVAWPLLYLSLFAALAAAIVTGLLLAERR